MIYRNQTNAMAQIQALGRMRITTVPEAIAYLRIQAAINAQIAQVLQTASIHVQRQLNQPVAPAPAPEPVSVPEPTKPFEPEELSVDEGFSEEEIEAKVEKLKNARKK